jgi:hypothetical protein
MIYSLFFFVFSTGWADQNLNLQTIKNNCIKNKAASIRIIIETGLEWKNNGESLLPAFKKVKSEALCNCIYDDMSNKLGMEKTNQIVQYKVPPSELIAVDNEKSLIYFSCVGKLLGQPGLTPPSPSEVRKSIHEKVKAPKSSFVLIRESELALLRIQNTITIFVGDKGRVPKNLNELVGAYMKEADLLDAWGNKLIYKTTGPQNYKIYSMGPDGTADTTDDIPPKRR